MKSILDLSKLIYTPKIENLSKNQTSQKFWIFFPFKGEKRKSGLQVNKKEAKPSEMPLRSSRIDFKTLGYFNR